jgi:hypothetical protein
LVKVSIPLVLLSEFARPVVVTEDYQPSWVDAYVDLCTTQAREAGQSAEGFSTVLQVYREITEELALSVEPIVQLTAGIPSSA